MRNESLIATLAVACACSGSAAPSPEGPTPAPAPAPAPTPAPTPKDPPVIPAGLAAPNELPTFEIPAHKAVGVGQEIGFGLEVIDEEQDFIRVDLVDKPASATYDPYTLTVVWKPTRADLGGGHFTVRVTEKQRATGVVRVTTHSFSIAVTRTKQPELHAQPMGPVVETLITIHDPERLAEVNKRWPLDKLLLHTAQLEYAVLPDDVRAQTAAPEAKALYGQFLKQLADANDNPRVDPASPEFDKKSFGKPSDWKIIAVRPRLDKKQRELRIVYKATAAHEATYAMFRYRVVADRPDLPPEAIPFNNREMSRLTLEAFFRPDGVLDPALLTDKKAHGKRVAAYVDSILTYQNADQPWARASFQALPCGARLGGGSTRGPDGAYESGDGWAWHVMKVKPHDGRMEYINVPIKGFLSDVAPTAAGDAYELRCPPRFGALCRPTGHTDLPGAGDGYDDHEVVGGEVISARVDAAHMFVTHKREHLVSSVALDDPRRDLFEEKGMTCHQCHVRKFGVRDMYDPTAYDPRAGLPAVRNKKQATTYFVIVPTVSWQPYAIDFQHKQECKFAAAIEADLGVRTSLGCPLKAE